MSNIEKIDLKNIYEVERIRDILSKDTQLLDIFNYIMMIANKTLNVEPAVASLPIEPDVDITFTDDESESDWSQHTSDDDFIDDSEQIPPPSP